MVRTRRNWRRSSWSKPSATADRGLRLLRETLTDLLDQHPEHEQLTVRKDDIRQVLRLAEPEPVEHGAAITDPDRGVVYRVTLDTAGREVRIKSVQIERLVVPSGIRGWTAKGGELRPKGKPGTYLAPYDESVFRVPVQELIAQTLAVFESEIRVNPDASTAIVIGGRDVAAPSAEELRQHLLDGMTVQQLATRYDRKPRSVYAWLAAARRSTPHLDWPEVKHGPTVGRGK